MFSNFIIQVFEETLISFFKIVCFIAHFCANMQKCEDVLALHDFMFTSIAILCFPDKQKNKIICSKNHVQNTNGRQTDSCWQKY